MFAIVLYVENVMQNRRRENNFDVNMGQNSDIMVGAICTK